MPAMEYPRPLVFGYDLVQPIGHSIVGKEPLQGRMELEAPDPVLLDQSSRFAHAKLALVRIDPGKGQHDVAVVARGIADLLVWGASGTDLGFHVDRKHHESNPALPVVRDRLGYRRARRCLEISAGCVLVSLPE